MVYLGAAVARTGIPTLAGVRAAVDRPGYVELAGAGLGLPVGYPVVGFRRTVPDGGGVLDVYVQRATVECRSGRAARPKRQDRNQLPDSVIVTSVWAARTKFFFSLMSMPHFPLSLVILCSH